MVKKPRILVITSCTGEKLVSDEHALTLNDFQAGAEHVRIREQELSQKRHMAEELYTGLQHQRLMRGIRALRQNGAGVDVDLFVLSAGYGLIRGDRVIAPYECTFAGMKKKELDAWSTELNVANDIRQILAKPYDLALVLLGDSYLRACQFDEQVELGGPALFFTGAAAGKKLPNLPGSRTIILSNAEARKFSCGLVGLKGEIAARLLERVGKNLETLRVLADPATQVLECWDPGIKKKQPRPKARSNPKVDQVIGLSDSWKGKPHRERLQYFIPEWDDLVDPDYDFATDTHSGGTGDWSNEVYAHQMYPEPSYDGLLISKVVAEKSKKKKDRINALGVHRFLRVPRQFPVMGDCGAFGYIGEDVPPYSTEEILDYYTRLDFDLGVSVDHLIVSSTETQKKERYQLTIQNAEDFLSEHTRRGLPWTPIGAVQGWDPASYANAVKQYVGMGYKYIALGGLVRSPTKEILRMLEEVHKVVPSDVSIHLFGLARVAALDQFAKLGVRSVDSASLLRRAWMGTGQNYLTMEAELYAAIRIPGAAKSFRAKRIVAEGRATEEQVRRLEEACLKIVHQFDRGEVGVEDTLDVLQEYDQLITPDRPDNRVVLRRVLEAAPWKECKCEICKKDGIDVIIFRGNNRNRRRGFHNTYVFYQLFQRALAGEMIDFNTSGKKASLAGQKDLFSPQSAAC